MTIAEVAEVSAEFLYNVIDSRAIEARFQEVGAKWVGHRKLRVHIPWNVGTPLNTI
jgi:hypothetical protein